MGHYITYTLELRIRAKHFKRALEIFNNLHSDEMLEKYATRGNYEKKNKKLPVKERKWYAMVNNPKQPYSTLKEAFENWWIVENDKDIYIDEDTNEFVITGKYENKIAQQGFLIEQLAPVLKNTIISVTGQDGSIFQWIVKDHKFFFVNLYEHDNDEKLSDDEELSNTMENMKLAM